MLGRLVALAAVTMLALGAMSSSFTSALELKGKQRKQGIGLPVPAVQKIRGSGTQTKGSGPRDPHRLRLSTEGVPSFSPKGSNISAIKKK